MGHMHARAPRTDARPASAGAVRLATAHGPRRVLWSAGRFGAG